MLRDPRRGADVLVEFFPNPGDRPLAAGGFVDVGLAGEGDDLCIGRQGWRLEKIQRPRWDQRMLETQTPRRREKIHVAERAADEGLAVPIEIHHRHRVGAETIPDFR